MTTIGKYDLLLKSGHVIDPANGIDQQRDVAIKDGKIVYTVTIEAKARSIVTRSNTFISGTIARSFLR